MIIAIQSLHHKKKLPIFETKKHETNLMPCHYEYFLPELGSQLFTKKLKGSHNQLFQGKKCQKKEHDKILKNSSF